MRRARAAEIQNAEHCHNATPHYFFSPARLALDANGVSKQFIHTQNTLGTPFPKSR
jgi:hypothetical protein